MSNITLPGSGLAVSTRQLANSDHVQLMGLDMGSGTDERLVFDRGTIPRSIDPGVPVRPIPADFWRCGFAGVAASGLATSDVTLLQTGAGMAVSQSGGNLVVTTGVTANSETVIRSNRTFRGGLAMRHKMTLSQRIANQTFRVELAELHGENLSYTINSATSVTVTFPAGTNPFTAANVSQSMRMSRITGAAGIPGRYAIASVSGDTVTFTVAGWPATGSGTMTLYGRNNIWTEYSGTTATNANVDAARDGWASGNTLATIQSTASPGHVMQLMTDTLSAAWSDALVASSTAVQWTERGNRIENIPDDDVEMYLFIVVQNGSTAPASSTTMTVGYVQCEMQGRQKVRIATVDQAGATQGMPVNVRGTPAVSITGNPVLGAGANAIGDVGQQYRANATGAASGARVIAAAGTNAAVVKASAGRVLGWQLSNPSTGWRYVKLHNTTTAPTVGTTAVARTIGIAPGGKSEIAIEGGIAFGTGISLSITGGAADADATAVAANDVVGDVFFA